MSRIGLASKAYVVAVLFAAFTYAFGFAASIDAPAVIREYDREAALPLWPNFAPLSIPVAVFDGSKTWLYRHPAPPSEFAPVAGNDALRVADGRYEGITANTSSKINGVMTATLLSEATTSLPRQASLLMHEAFHVYQRQRHPDWSANEADAFLYPFDKAETIQLRRLETEALRRALDATGDQCRCWARTALDMRAARFGQLTPSAVEYERRTELNEGLAQYVEDRAAGQVRQDLLPAGEYEIDAVRLRAYSVGEALGLLLDRFDPPPTATQKDPRRFIGEWREELDSGRGKFLDQILERRLAGAKSCEFYAPEKRQALQRAESDVSKLQQQRDQALRDFHAQPGWRIVVEAGDNTFGMQGFDPLNVKLVAKGLILHNRYLKLGGNGAAVEMLQGHALTESAGQHPLFSGVRRLTVAGIATPPSINEKDGGVSISAPGFKADFTKASVSRDDTAKQITITF